MKAFSLTALTLALVLSACGDKGEDSGSGSAATDCSADGLDGASLYSSSCAGCHGADGSGASGPSLEDAMPVHSDDELRAVMEDGAPGMPSFENSMECGEREAVLEYLRSQHGQQGGAGSD